VRKRDNPYTPGAGRKPRTLSGRDQDIEAFQSLVERLGAGSYERSLVYTGLRGVGKTVLLMELDVLASEAGWATTDVQEVGASPDFRITFARMAARLLLNMSRRHRAEQRIERALSVVKAFSIALRGALEIKLDVEAARGVADSGDPELDLAGLFQEIGEVAQANQMGALFLIDEMQNLNGPALAAICMAFQAVSRAGLPVSMVAAGLPDLRVRLLSAKPYADRLFSYAELGRLSDAAARSALVGPAAAAGVDYDEETARRIVAESAGFPYFIQEYGRELWNFADSSPIDLADLDGARAIVKDALARNFFGTRFEMATDAEQRYLAAMASLGDGPYPVSAVARAYGVDDQRRVSVHRDSLIQKGLVWSPRRGQLDFTVPLFAEYLQNNALPG
jgi:hypothetical protein